MLILALCLTGCASANLIKRYPNGGLVKYKNGLSAEASLAYAKELMTKHCDGEYTVENSYQSSTVSSYKGNIDTDMLGNQTATLTPIRQNWAYIKFSCVQ